MQVLVVEDEPKLRALLSEALDKEGFDVMTAADGGEAIQLHRANRPEVVVLDLGLPVLDGHTVLRQVMKEDPDCRVIVLSSHEEVSTRVDCFERGAIDFVPKPFSMTELLARLRRQQRSTREWSRSNAGTLRVGKVTLDLSRRLVRIAGRETSLSQREFVLLQHLMQRAGRACSREELLADVWGYTFDPGSNVVDVYIKRLRTKVPLLKLQTVRNVGYTVVAG